MGKSNLNRTVILLVMCLSSIIASQVKAALKITGIMYNPFGIREESTCAWEWVEIYNNGTSSINLAGYVLDDDDGGQYGSANILSGSIPAGGFAYLYNASQITAAMFQRDWGKCNTIGVTNWSGLNNTGDKIGLWSNYSSYNNDHVAQNHVVDSVNYYPGTNGWPGINDGQEIFLWNIGGDNDDPDNWDKADADGLAGYLPDGGLIVDDVNSVEYAMIRSKPRLLITQIMYNPDGDDTDKEWVEIYNSWPIEINLAGYVLDDKNGTAHISANVSGGTILPYKTAYLIPEGYTDYFQDIWGRCNVISVSNWDSMGLNNGGDGVGIWRNYSEYSGDQSNHYNVLDSVVYDEASWPSSEGYSIYLADVKNIDSQNGVNWRLIDLDNRGQKTSAGGIIDRDFIAIPNEGGYDYAAIDTNPNNREVVFRYRSFIGSRPFWVSPITSAGNIVHQTGSGGDVVSVNRGEGFEPFLSTDFDGSEYVQGANPVNTREFGEDDGFTIEAWFKADSVSGTRTLFSNVSGNYGFRLGVKTGGVLFGDVYFITNTGQVSLQTISSDAGKIVAGYWHYAVLQVSWYGSTDYEIRLYLDDSGVAFKAVNGILPNGSVYYSSAKPLVGSGFDGRISAVRVSNYPMYVGNYVSIDRVLDGGCYFGDPYYHDDDNTKNLDYIYHRTATDSHYADEISEYLTQHFQVPFMNDRYVPQGIAYDSTNDYIYQVFYWKDVDGTIGTYPSILAEVSRDTGKLRHVYRLKDNTSSHSLIEGHCSCAAWCNGYLYIASGSKVYIFQPSVNNNHVFNTHTFENGRFDEESLTAVGNFNLYTSVKLLDIRQIYNGSYILWAGRNQDGHFWIDGYQLNSATGLGSLIYIFRLPDEFDIGVQGLVCYDSIPGDGYATFKFYVSGFYDGNYDTPAKLSYAWYNTISSQAVSHQLVTKLPPGIEDLTMVGNDVWACAESGSRCYQKRSIGTPWVLMYPFIYGLDGDKLPQ